MNDPRITYTKYDLDNGIILGHSITTEPNLTRPGIGIVLGKFDRATTYFPNGQETTRPINIATLDKTDIDADGVDVATISDIPAGTKYAISGPIPQAGEIVGTELEITTTIAGEYKVTLRSFPEVEKEFIINAT